VVNFRRVVELLLLLRGKLIIVSPNSITSDQFPIVDVEPVRNLVGINRNELAQLQATDLLWLIIYTALETLADKPHVG